MFSIKTSCEILSINILLIILRKQQWLSDRPALITPSPFLFPAKFQSFIQFLTCHACVAFGTEQLGCDFLASMHRHISIFSFVTIESHGWCVWECPAGKLYQRKPEGTPTLTACFVFQPSQRKNHEYIKIWGEMLLSGVSATHAIMGNIDYSMTRIIPPVIYQAHQSSWSVTELFEYFWYDTDPYFLHCDFVVFIFAPQ